MLAELVEMIVTFWEWYDVLPQMLGQGETELHPDYWALWIVTRVILVFLVGAVSSIKKEPLIMWFCLLAIPIVPEFLLWSVGFLVIPTAPLLAIAGLGWGSGSVATKATTRLKDFRSGRKVIGEGHLSEADPIDGALSQVK